MKTKHHYDLDKYFLKAASNKGLLQQVFNILAMCNQPNQYIMPFSVSIIYIALLEACEHNQLDVCRLLMSHCTNPLNKDSAMQLQSDLGYTHCTTVGELRKNIFANCMAHAIANYNIEILRALQKYTEENNIQIDCGLLIKIAIEKQNAQLMIYCVENYSGQMQQIDEIIHQIATSNTSSRNRDTANLVTFLLNYMPTY